jgi:hypothetical protein
MRAAATLIVLAALALPAQAQQQPYAGDEAREIKSLSADEIKQLLSGAGMGYAKSAELNHFPGPMHVLEMADQLSLSAQQRSDAKRLMDRHKAEARALGAKVVESEQALEVLFRTGSVDEAALSMAVGDTAAAHGAYRLSHLETHRRMRALLSDAQVEGYDRQRGYTGDPGTQQKHKH